MFVKRTVLILGAAASSPYGFPLGSKLVENIIGLEKDPEFIELLLSQGLDSGIAKELSEALVIAGPSSIDLFLDNRDDKFGKVGKLAIALVLMRCENEGAIDYRRTDAWYHTLANYLGERRPDLRTNRLSILTFNYDRSLEHSLHQIFQYRFGMSSEDAANAVARFDIRHVYGQLGHFEWQTYTDRNFLRRYATDHTLEEIAQAASQIRLIHQVERDGPDLQQLQERIYKADQVFLLGFGYHDENMDILKLKDNSSKLIGSIYRVAFPRMAELREELPGSTLFEGTITEMLSNCPEFYKAASAKREW